MSIPQIESRLIVLYAVVFLCGVLALGCASTRDVTVDYPVPAKIAEQINSAGSKAVVALADSEVLAVQRLTVDSVSVRWLDGEWREEPLANVVSMTLEDPAEKGNQMLTGALYTAAAFGAIGVIDGLSQDRSNVAGEALLVAGAGGLLAALTYDVWGPMTAPRIRYLIRPPQTAREMTQREIDRIHVEQGPGVEELNARSRNGRIEPTFLYGSANSVNPESDPSSPLVVGGGITFGFRTWEQLEIGLQFLLASHSFNRKSSTETVRSFSFSLIGTFFPLEHSGLFVRGGIGYGSYSANGTYTGSVTTTPPVTPSGVTGDGIALLIGGGYDIRLSDAWSIRPAVEYIAMPLGDLKLNDKAVIASGATSKMIVAMVAVVFKGVM